MERHILEKKSVIDKAISTKVVSALQGIFPVESKGYKVDISNIKVKIQEPTYQAQTDNRLQKGSIYNSVYADLTVVDPSGVTIDIAKNHKILNYPYYSNRGTLAVGGTEYAIVNQLRTKPGVYTRKKENEEVVASINTGTGANYDIILDPDTGIIKVSMLNLTIPIYSFLKIMDVEDSKIEAALGKILYDTNKAKGLKVQAVVEKLFPKTAGYKTKEEDLSPEAKRQHVKNYLLGQELNEGTTNITLGKPFSKVSGEAILLTLKKLVAVNKEEGDSDERDNLEFQTIHSVEDILSEALTKSKESVQKIRNRLRDYVDGKYTSPKDILPTNILSSPIKSFITSSSISRAPEQINPLEFIDIQSKVTRLGEGAIGNERAVPNTTRAMHLSYLGVIDPIATPESSKVGIDSSFTMGAIKGKDNELVRVLLNMKTGKNEKKSVIDTYFNYVGLPRAPHGKEDANKVSAIYKGKLVEVPLAKLDYRIKSPNDLLSATSASVPMLNAIQANRTLMADKHQQQALPLENPDVKLVRSYAPKGSGVNPAEVLNSFLRPFSPVDGVVTKISDSFIHVVDANKEEHLVEYTKNFPLASKTLLNNKLTVSIGDKVKKGQALGDSNFTKGQEMTVGKNLSVAYIPYENDNHEDGVVISRSAANKLTSMHGEQITLDLFDDIVVDKKRFVAAFPMEFTSMQLNKIGDNGIVLEGAILEEGDPIILAMKKTNKSSVNTILASFHKSLAKEYSNIAEICETEGDPAEVLEVRSSKRLISVLLQIKHPAKLGDKLAGTYGNKGVITRILDDDKMLKGEDGKPMDILLTPVGVPSRINPAQIHEAILGKIAKKTGKRYDMENFAIDNLVDFTEKEMKKNKVSDKETILDPITGKKIKGIATGVAHFHKLFKTTETNYAARGTRGRYNMDETPAGSGIEGAKGMGQMEVNALIAHNARGLLHDASVIRSGKNLDFWNSFKSGGIPLLPKEKRTFDRFSHILNQAGVNLVKEGTTFSLVPLTDKDVLARSNGEIKKALRLKGLEGTPEVGGLYDPKITGGIKGEKWSHISLEESVVNPLFKDALRYVLGISGTQLTEMLLEEGADKLRKELDKLNIPKMIADTKKLIDNPKTKGLELDALIKKYKALQSLEKNDMKIGEAYFMKEVPILPPKYRQTIIDSQTGDIMEADSNIFYKELILQNNSFKSLKAVGASKEDLMENRKNLLGKVEELVGTVTPTSKQMQAKNMKGAITFIKGSTPKEGYFQNNVIASKLNLSGRATIAPDSNLGLDEVGLPEDQAWGMYEPMLIRSLVQAGIPPITAKNKVRDRDITARAALLDEIKKRPVIVNRPPTLHRHNMIAAFPKLITGKTMRINPLWETSLNADYDGDAMTIHVPVTDNAVTDALGMLASQQVLSDAKRDDILMKPKAEAVIGLYKATLPATKKKVRRFPSADAAWKAYLNNTLDITDPVNIG